MWSTTLTVINKKFVLSQKQIFQESVFFHLSFVRFPAHSINDLFLSEVVKSRFTKVSLLLIPKGSKSAPVVFSKMKKYFLPKFWLSTYSPIWFCQNVLLTFVNRKMIFFPISFIWCRRRYQFPSTFSIFFIELVAHIHQKPARSKKILKEALLQPLH